MARRLWRAIGGVALPCVAGRAAGAQPDACPPVPAIVSDTTVFVACQVDEAARLRATSAIRMPSMLRHQGIRGTVVADAAVARGTGGQWYVCVAERDGTNAKCASATAGWVH